MMKNNGLSDKVLEAIKQELEKMESLSEKINFLNKTLARFSDYEEKVEIIEELIKSIDEDIDIYIEEDSVEDIARSEDLKNELNDYMQQLNSMLQEDVKVQTNKIIFAKTKGDNCKILERITNKPCKGHEKGFMKLFDYFINRSNYKFDEDTKILKLDGKKVMKVKNTAIINRGRMYGLYLPGGYVFLIDVDYKDGDKQGNNYLRGMVNNANTSGLLEDFKRVFAIANAANRGDKESQTLMEQMAIENGKILNEIISSLNKSNKPKEDAEEQLELKCEKITWDVMYDLLNDIYEEAGYIDYNLIDEFKDISLLEWILEQQELYKKGQLSEDKKEMLENIGISFEEKIEQSENEIQSEIEENPANVQLEDETSQKIDEDKESFIEILSLDEVKEESKIDVVNNVENEEIQPEKDRQLLYLNLSVEEVKKLKEKYGTFMKKYEKVLYYFAHEQDKSIETDSIALLYIKQWKRAFDNDKLTEEQIELIEDLGIDLKNVKDLTSGEKDTDVLQVESNEFIQEEEKTNQLEEEQNASSVEASSEMSVYAEKQQEENVQTSEEEVEFIEEKQNKEELPFYLRYNHEEAIYLADRYGKFAKQYDSVLEYFEKNKSVEGNFGISRIINKWKEEYKKNKLSQEQIEIIEELGINLKEDNLSQKEIVEEDKQNTSIDETASELPVQIEEQQEENVQTSEEEVEFIEEKQNKEELPFYLRYNHEEAIYLADRYGKFAKQYDCVLEYFEKNKSVEGNYGISRIINKWKEEYKKNKLSQEQIGIIEELGINLKENNLISKETIEEDKQNTSIDEPASELSVQTEEHPEVNQLDGSPYYDIIAHKQDIIINAVQNMTEEQLNQMLGYIDCEILDLVENEKKVSRHNRK